MAIRVKSAADTSAKWNRKVQGAGEDYSKGVNDSGVDWAGPTKAAEGNYKEAVTKAASEGRFGKGVSVAGTEKWRAKTTTKGVERWGPGVRDAQPEYEKGMGPVLQAIASTNLPARGPSGDPRNLQRVAAVNNAVHNATKGK